MFLVKLKHFFCPRVFSSFGEPKNHQSYGFREGRNAHAAVRRVQAGWELGLSHAVDCDLKALLTLRALRVLLRRICLPSVGSTL